jgi:hypothetical protein
VFLVNEENTVVIGYEFSRSGNGVDCGWPTSEDALLPGRAQQFRTGALAAKDTGL